MKGTVPDRAVYSRKGSKSFATIITTLTCIIIIPALTMPTDSITNSPPHKSCESDYECPDNFYCYTRRSPQQYCAPCYPCSRLNRGSAASGCAKSREECGPCLNGFHGLGIICSRVPDDFAQDNHNANMKAEAESTETGFSWWNLCIAGAIFTIAIVLLIVILILWKRPRWRRGPRMRSIEKDIELNDQTACKSFLPSAPQYEPPQYEESEPFGRRLGRGAFLVRESAQGMNPLSLPEELLNNQEIIIVDDDGPPDNPHDDILDALDEELEPESDEEPEAQLPGVVPVVDNFGDGWENQDISLHEESVHLDNPIEAAAVLPEDRSPIQPLPEGNNSPFEMMLNIGFHLEVNWAELAINIDQERTPQRSRNDSGVAEISAHSSMDHIVPNLDNPNENLETFSAPHAGSVSHAGRRLESVYEGPLSLAHESLDEGFSAEETGLLELN